MCVDSKNFLYKKNKNSLQHFNRVIQYIHLPIKITSILTLPLFTIEPKNFPFNFLREKGKSVEIQVNVVSIWKTKPKKRRESFEMVAYIRGNVFPLAISINQIFFSIPSSSLVHYLNFHLYILWHRKVPWSTCFL